MFQGQNRETINSTRKVAVSFKIIYDDERDKIMFHKTTSDLQDQDQDRFFWSQTSLVLRMTVSAHTSWSYLTIDSVGTLSKCFLMLLPTHVLEWIY